MIKTCDDENDAHIFFRVTKQQQVQRNAIGMLFLVDISGSMDTTHM
jgi:Mg-chelatase subunit ChlD